MTGAAPGGGPAAGGRRLSVSVVLPVLNRAGLVADALRTITGQTEPAQEVVVVDGGSTDATCDVVRRWTGVRLIQAPGTGTAEAYNLGVAETSGEVVAFAASDDLLRPTAIELHRRALADRPECAMSVGLTHFFGDTPNPLTPRRLAGTTRRARVLEAVAVRREAWDRHGGFRPELGPGGFDLEWLSRMADAGVRIAEIDDVTLHKRLHQANATYNAGITPQILGALRQSVLRRRRAPT